jgi:hypothetical protein
MLLAACQPKATKKAIGVGENTTKGAMMERLFVVQAGAVGTVAQGTKVETGARTDREKASKQAGILKRRSEKDK